MTLSEFKAWFEGFTEGLEAAPTKAQFDRIKAKVADITGTPITQTVYVDRYIEALRYYHQYPWNYRQIPWDGRPFWGTVTGAGATGGYASAVGAVSGSTVKASAFGGSVSNTLNLDGNPGFGPSFDSHSAMHALGKAEAAIN